MTVAEIRKFHEKHKDPAREFCQACVLLDSAETTTHACPTCGDVHLPKSTT